MAAAAFLCLAVISLPRPAAACSSCACSAAKDNTVSGIIKTLHPITNKVFEESAKQFKEQFLPEFFESIVKVGSAEATAQMTAASMTQMAAIGSMMDAGQQLDSQRLMQEKAALAHKKYRTSEGLCTMGTAASGLGTAASRADATSAILDQRMQSRQWRRAGTVQEKDIAARFELFRDRFCDPASFGGVLSSAQGKICRSGNSKSFNRDIDATATLFQPASLSFDLLTGDGAGDSPDMIALGDNLFANRIFSQGSNNLYGTASQHALLLDLRAVAAKRSVATHSFAEIAGMKASGGPESASIAPYVQGVMRQMGASEAEAAALIGAQPGYDTLMEVLSKRIYENPAFYSNLYDSPANLVRKGAAIRAVDLMQNFDSYKSRLRQEMLLSVIVEQKLMAEQNRLSTDLQPRPANAGGQ